MKWPWQKTQSSDRLVVCWDGQTLAYTEARTSHGTAWSVMQMGQIRRDADTLQQFAQRLGGLKLRDRAVRVVLSTEQSTMLQIAAPAVPEDELRSAARYQIKGILDSHIDDLTLDVVRVGDGQDKAAGQLFVVAAANHVIREIMQLAELMDWSLEVIDVQEMVQRNLQLRWAEAAGLGTQATAVLSIVNEQQSVLTVSALGELFYTRRLELPTGFWSDPWVHEQEHFEAASPVDSYTPVTEYIPDHASNQLDDSSAAGESAQRLLLELQRSLDLWDRSWTQLPLAGIGLLAGDRSAELAAWLSRGLGHHVTAIETSELFTQLPKIDAAMQFTAPSLLGAVWRDD